VPHHATRGGRRTCSCHPRARGAGPPAWRRHTRRAQCCSTLPLHTACGAVTTHGARNAPRKSRATPQHVGVDTQSSASRVRAQAPGGGGGGDGARQGTSWRRRRACAGAGQRTEVHADCEGHLVRHIEQSGFHELFFRPGLPVPGAGARADSRDIHHEALSAARSGAVAAGTACHPQARAQAAHTGGAAPCPPNGTAGRCVRVPPAELGVSSVLRVIGCSGARRRVQPMTGGAPPLTGRARSARTAATTRRFTAGASRLRCVGMAQGAASLRECVGVSRVACRVRAATHHGPARWKSTSAAEVLLAPTRF